MSRIYALIIALFMVGAAPLLQAADPEPAAPGFAGLVEELDLSAEQKRALATIVKENRDETKAQIDAVVAARDKLRATIQAETFDERAIRQASRDVAAAEEALAVQRGRLVQAVRAELTDEQRETLASRRGQFRQRLESRVGAIRRLFSAWVDEHAG